MLPILGSVVSVEVTPNEQKVTSPLQRSNGFPLWILVAIGVAILVLVLFILIMKRKKRKEKR